MDRTVWIFLVLTAILMWSATSLLYKAGIHKDNEEHICLKYSVCVGSVFFVIALVYMIIRDEPFTIWESAVRYWPMTVFGIVYAIVNTISFNGYIYNEVTVESPVGRVDSIFDILTPLRATGLLVILISIILLSTVRNRAYRRNKQQLKSRWMRRGLGTLIFPVLFSVVDALETIVTGVCLDSTYGYAMPEGDSIIIVGMEYAVFAIGFWIYIYLKERKIYNPFNKKSAPCIFGAIADNVGIVFYSYAMAMNSVSTDPLIAVYPVFAMIGGRIIMKERVGITQYIFLLGIVAGSVMVIAGSVF